MVNVFRKGKFEFLALTKLKGNRNVSWRVLKRKYRMWDGEAILMNDV